MRLGGYVCIVMLLAGLTTWVASYFLEPKLYIISGNLRSFRTGASPWLSPISGYAPSDQGANYTNEIAKIAEEIDNRSMAVLMIKYGASVNVSRTIRAVVEDPSGRRVGVGYILNAQDGQKLVVVLPDGWVREYAMPAKG